MVVRARKNAIPAIKQMNIQNAFTGTIKNLKYNKLQTGGTRGIVILNGRFPTIIRSRQLVAANLSSNMNLKVITGICAGKILVPFLLNYKL